MSAVDFDAAVRTVVTSEIESALAPHRDLLDRMVAFLGQPPAASVSRRGGEQSRTQKAPTGDVSRLQVGQTVRYRQGRGEFDALITKIDAASGFVTLTRVFDNKLVERPASKVY